MTEPDIFSINGHFQTALNKVILEDALCQDGTNPLISHINAEQDITSLIAHELNCDRSALQNEHTQQIIKTAIQNARDAFEISINPYPTRTMALMKLDQQQHNTIRHLKRTM